MQYRQEINSPGIFLSEKTPGVSLFCNKVYLGWIYLSCLAQPVRMLPLLFGAPPAREGFLAALHPLTRFWGAAGGASFLAG